MLEIMEVILCIFCVVVFGWAVMHHCRSSKDIRKDAIKLDNVVPINFGKKSKLEENLQFFLDAEAALAKNETAKYMALKMKAIEYAKSNLNSGKSKQDKAV